MVVVLHLTQAQMLTGEKDCESLRSKPLTSIKILISSKIMSAHSNAGFVLPSIRTMARISHILKGENTRLIWHVVQLGSRRKVERRMRI